MSNVMNVGIKTLKSGVKHITLGGKHVRDVHSRVEAREYIQGLKLANPGVFIKTTYTGVDDRPEVRKYTFFITQADGSGLERDIECRYAIATKESLERQFPGSRVRWEDYVEPVTEDDIDF